MNYPQLPCCGHPEICKAPCRQREDWEKENMINQHDPVNKPSHYALLPGVEVIDVRDAIFAKMPIDVRHDIADCWSRSWEYLTRMWGKNGLEDAKKARFYLDRMIQKMEVPNATD